MSAQATVIITGALAFFFLTKQIPTVQDEVPDLNFLWVPLLVRILTVTGRTGL